MYSVSTFFRLILYQSKKCGHRIHVLFMMYNEIHAPCACAINVWKSDLSYAQNKNRGRKMHLLGMDTCPSLNDIMEIRYNKCTRSEQRYDFYNPAPRKGRGYTVLPLSVRPSFKIFFVTFFSVTVDGRNLIFGHKLHIGTPYRGKRFWTRQTPTSCLPTLLICIHIEHICSLFVAFF